MAQYRDKLPQLGGDLFLTDGGIETTLIFHEGFELPHFAAFDLLKRESGRTVLDRYFRGYASIASRYKLGFILESATWRASPDWGNKLGYSSADLAEANRKAIELLVDIRRDFQSAHTPIVISGCIGPRGDGYNPDSWMGEQEAQDYHATQAEIFSVTEADLITAITMTSSEEATGLARAARGVGMPVVISFTVETDGNLPSGQPLREAIAQVDDATGAAPAYYMINCAHPTHFRGALAAGETWVQRVRGLRANASTMSHAELDEAEELDDGDPIELGRQHGEIYRSFPQFNVLGGCCGTDHRHLEAIAASCIGRAAPPLRQSA